MDAGSLCDEVEMWNYVRIIILLWFAKSIGPDVSTETQHILHHVEQQGGICGAN